MKFIATTSDKIKDIAVISGQLIFSRDDRVIYLDTNERTSFQQIITLLDEEQRLGIVAPVSGYYFIKETKILWLYDNNEWIQITETPEKEVIYGQLPDEGKENVIYMNEQKIYRWSDESKSYIEMGIPSWENIS